MLAVFPRQAPWCGASSVKS